MSETDGSLFDVGPFQEPRFARDPRRQMPQPKNAAVQARNFGGWTLDKLDLFDLYLKQYRRVAGSGTYIDAFAGSGTVHIAGEPHPGSARVAIDSTAFKYIRLYETNLDLVNALEAMKASYPPKRRSRITITAGDVNQALRADFDAGLIDRSKPCFAFLDPDSTQLDWATVEALARYKIFEPGSNPRRPKSCKVELWILFNTHQALMRLVPHDRPANFASSGNARTLDRVMGGRDAWWDLLTTGFTYGTLLGRYVKRLEDLGYDLVRYCRIIDPADGSPQYYMVHASDHPAAHSFMWWAQKEQTIEAGRTPPLL